ncbi:4'-phosphopantetheinyl transferase family protein [Sinorhizobium arboris]|uniref:4'-phosphopantetheinyl transferase family protein n=1 Tax=Sinorhizobium arboris TaxID=76745 RepID=UPI00130EE4F9|nr:4'-phosphopantetheinyl transferase superfamily protein [Sinorhizobium arboris]
MFHDVAHFHQVRVRLASGDVTAGFSRGSSRKKCAQQTLFGEKMLPLKKGVVGDECVYSFYDIGSFVSGKEPIPERLRVRLPADELRETSLVVDAAERTRRLVAKAILRGNLANILDVEPSSLVFGRGPTGKPFLSTQRFQWLRFNLSHSGDFVATATGRTELGIDIERHRLVSDAGDLMHRYFCEDEHQLFLGTDVSSQMETFFSLWTRKEALLKAMGTGFSRLLDSVSVVRDDVIEGSWRVCSIVAPIGYSAAISWHL